MHRKAQHVTATHSTSRQHTARHGNTQHVTATHSASRQHTARHGNTQRVTATHSTSRNTQHVTATHSTEQIDQCDVTHENLPVITRILRPLTVATV
ncbi:hypothetical protein ACOMHN_056599 [Nucella lapillus]